MTHEPFFLADKDGFRPTPVCRGPWDPGSLHGRVVAGLLAHEIERQHGDPALMPARLTVDLYRLPDFSPVVVTTSIVRNGRRIKVVDAEFLSNGVSVGRATCQLLRRSENPPGRVWSPPPWNAPKPHEIAVPEDVAHALGGMWAVRPIEGAFGTVGRKRLWMSEVRELVGGVALTPWVRAALAADFASPFANSGDAGLGYINSDITMYLTRLPRTPWVGFDVVDHHADDGIAFGECRMYDEDGPIGASSVCALAQSRRPVVPPAS
jgi:hypothetical protein